MASWLRRRPRAFRSSWFALNRWIAACQRPPPLLVQQEPANDADGVATELADAGVLAVFTSSPTQSDTVNAIPFVQPGTQSSTQVQIPEYEGGAVGYQQGQNHGVLWYSVSVNTATDKVSVQGIPVVQSLALEPLDGLTAPRSSTLFFQAVGRRPAGSLLPGDDPEGIANYVNIPSSACSSISLLTSSGSEAMPACVAPSYQFTSSNPLVGNFVAPSGTGSQVPKLTSAGKTTASSSSGLFCAFNPGTTTVSVTSGLLTSSLTVTVQPGDIGQPCGSVADSAAANVVVVPGGTVVSSATQQGGNPAGAPPPATAAKVATKLPAIKVKIPSPSPAPTPAPVTKPKPVVFHAAPPVHVPAPGSPPFITPAFNAFSLTPGVAPPPPPPVTTVPPGGATAPAQSTAKREEKARKHASQSAYVIRPAGSTVEEWFYPAIGVMTVFALFLIANGIRIGAEPKLAYARTRTNDDPSTRRRRY